MNTTFSQENLFKLIEANKDDSEIIDLIFQSVLSFEEYHRSIFDMEMKRKIFKNDNMDTKEYQDMVVELDRARTYCHNDLIANVSILNRIAERSGIGPVYGGVVSKERPHRRDVANAVLKFVEDVILNRR